MSYSVASDLRIHYLLRFHAIIFWREKKNYSLLNAANCSTQESFFCFVFFFSKNYCPHCLAVSTLDFDSQSPRFKSPKRGWSGVAKVSCILRHRGVQLILAYSWARLAVLVAGKGRGGMFLFLHFHSCSSFFPVLLFDRLYYRTSAFLWETT